MKKLACILFGAFIFVAAQSCQDSKHAKNYNDKTLTDDEGLAFIKNGIEGGLTEIKAAELAKKNSTNPKVIGFADMMIADHTDADKGLKTIEKNKLVDDRDVISYTHQKMLDSLSKKSGAEFDKAYMQMMVADHDKAVALFSEASNNTSNMIQDFARKTLPKLEMHLDSAKAITATLK